MSDSNSISDLVLNADVTNFDKFLSAEKLSVYSEPRTIGDFTLTMVVKIKKKEQRNLLPPCLGIFLRCGHLKSKKYQCLVKGVLKVITQNPDNNDFTREYEHVFSNAEEELGFSRYMSLEDVNRAYIKNNTVHIEAHLCVKSIPLLISPKKKTKSDVQTPVIKKAKIAEADDVTQLKRHLATENLAAKEIEKTIEEKSLELLAKKQTINNLQSKIEDLEAKEELNKLSIMSAKLDLLNNKVNALQDLELKVGRLEKLQEERDKELQNIKEELKIEKQKRDNFRGLLKKVAEFDC